MIVNLSAEPIHLDYQVNCPADFVFIRKEANPMNKNDLYRLWKREEQSAHIHGWDFSHIKGRYEEEQDLPWNYEEIVRGYLKDNSRLLDYDTGGGEFLLSLNHPYHLTYATEGYKPNVELCRDRLVPLGVNFKECADSRKIPFDGNSFDIIINRHGDFVPREIYRLLRNNGVFITEQVGSENDRDLVEMVLSNTPKPFPNLNLPVQQAAFEKSGLEIIKAEEAFRPIRFYDVGAFVWFARIIEWEFPGFSVDKCFDRLIEMQKIVDEQGVIEGTIHRYLIVARAVK